MLERCSIGSVQAGMFNVINASFYKTYSMFDIGELLLFGSFLWLQLLIVGPRVCLDRDLVTTEESPGEMGLNRTGFSCWPTRTMEFNLETDDRVQRWFTEPLTRTMIPGTRRHSRYGECKPVKPVFGFSVLGYCRTRVVQHGGLLGRRSAPSEHKSLNHLLFSGVYVLIYTSLWMSNSISTPKSYTLWL